MLFGFQRPDLNPACNPFCEPLLQPDEQPTKIILNCQHLFFAARIFFLSAPPRHKSRVSKGTQFLTPLT